MHCTPPATRWEPRPVADVVIDASAMVDALAGTPLGPAVVTTDTGLAIAAAKGELIELP